MNDDRPSDSQTMTTLKAAASSPMLTITGPLGFGGLFLFYQLQDIKADLESAAKAQQELSAELVELRGDFRIMQADQSSRREDVDELQAGMADLRGRVERLEQQESKKRGR